MCGDSEGELELIISMSVLEDLGINLYGSVPAVLAEVVSNAWDADAHLVEIDFDTTTREITIQDDGIGMTRREMQNFYLTVGYKRRREGRTKTPDGRNPMGRKGIGKLSLFSIADKVTVETIKDGEKTAILMDVETIKKSIEGAPEGRGRYYPTQISGTWNFGEGTRITLKDLRKDRIRFDAGLRKRLARRFFMIGQDANFQVRIFGKPLTADDRGYVNLVQYLWTIGKNAEWKEVNKIAQGAIRSNELELEGSEPQIRGWIGTAHRSQDLTRDDNNANNVVLMVREKWPARTSWPVSVSVSWRLNTF